MRTGCSDFSFHNVVLPCYVGSRYHGMGRPLVVDGGDGL
jgi:hypothetical protein